LLFTILLNFFWGIYKPMMAGPFTFFFKTKLSFRLFFFNCLFYVVCFILSGFYAVVLRYFGDSAHERNYKKSYFRNVTRWSSGD